jgi:hypothetical protein
MLIQINGPQILRIEKKPAGSGTASEGLRLFLLSRDKSPAGWIENRAVGRDRSVNVDHQFRCFE